MSTDPAQKVLDLANRVVADVEAVGHEVVGLTGDVAAATLEVVQLAKDKVIALEKALVAAVGGK